MKIQQRRLGRGGCEYFTELQTDTSVRPNLETMSLCHPFIMNAGLPAVKEQVRTPPESLGHIHWGNN